MAISAGGVGLAAMGGILVWGGLANASPLSVLRDLVAGKPTQIAVGAQGAGPQVGDTGAVGVQGSATSAANNVAAKSIPGVSSIGAEIVAGAMQYKGDLYSQTKRAQDGYSDCSSFVSKALIAAGIAPCGNPGSLPTTAQYALWSALYSVTDGTAQPGDILLAPGVHIAIVMGPNSAIGQENPQINVRTGSFNSIMAGTGTWGQYRIDDTKLKSNG
jgi:cell wall-associated NlpC family hydrolase